MNKYDVDTSSMKIETLLSKKSSVSSDGVNIRSGKINPITDENEINLVSGGGIPGWGQIWGRAWVAWGANI